MAASPGQFKELQDFNVLKKFRDILCSLEMCCVHKTPVYRVRTVTVNNQNLTPGLMWKLM